MFLHPRRARRASIYTHKRTSQLLSERLPVYHILSAISLSHNLSDLNNSLNRTDPGSGPVSHRHGHLGCSARQHCGFSTRVQHMHCMLRPPLTAKGMAPNGTFPAPIPLRPASRERLHTRQTRFFTQGVIGRHAFLLPLASRTSESSPQLEWAAFRLLLGRHPGSTQTAGPAGVTSSVHAL